jgi:hypothetical protein
MSYVGTAGFWSDLWEGIKDVAGEYFAPEVVSAVARAFASPTQANIAAVRQAFRDQGTSPPPELLNALYERYYDSLRRYPAVTVGGFQEGAQSLLPWILGGIVLIWALRR